MASPLARPAKIRSSVAFSASTLISTSASFLLDRQGVIRWVHPGPEYHPGGPEEHEPWIESKRRVSKDFTTALAGGLDRIYYRGGVHLQTARTCRLSVSRVASDHLPVIADFELS